MSWRVVSPPNYELPDKGPRPKLCQRCHAPAVWADLTYNPTTVIDGQGKVRFFEQPRLDYWCDECATLNPIKEKR